MTTAAQDSSYIGGHCGLKGRAAISSEKTTAKNVVGRQLLVD